MAEMAKILSSEEDGTAEFKKDGLLTGKEMIMKRAVSGQRYFTSVGSREYRPTNSWLEKKQIENCLDERLLMVKSERIEKLSDLSIAEWIPDLNKAKLVKKCGKHWDVFGHHKDDSDWLYPEETLFLIEMNILQLIYAEIPVSIEQAYLLLINEDCSLNEYRVFSYLSKKGYKVVRHFRDTFVDRNKKTAEKSNNNVQSLISDCSSRPDQSEKTTEKLTDDSDVQSLTADGSSRPVQSKTTTEKFTNDSDVQSLTADRSSRSDQSETTTEKLTKDSDVPSLTADGFSRPDPSKTMTETSTNDTDVQSLTADGSSRPDLIKTTTEKSANDTDVLSLTADGSSRPDPSKTTTEKSANDTDVLSLTADGSSRPDPSKTTTEKSTNDTDVQSLTAAGSSRPDPSKTTTEKSTNDSDVHSLTSNGSSRPDPSKTTTEKSTNGSDVLSLTEDCPSNPEQSKITAEESKNNMKSSTADCSSSNQCEKMEVKSTNGSDSSEERPSSPDVMIIENTIDIIDLDESADEAEPGDSRIVFLNKAGSRSWYPRLNLVFSNTQNKRKIKTFKKSDFFDLGFKTKMDILRLIDRDPHSNMIKPPDQRFIPKGIKIKYGLYMIDVKKTKIEDVPSTSRNPPKPRRHFQHRFKERRNAHHSATPMNPWAYNQPFVHPMGNYNNFNNPMMAVMNMMATAMNMFQPQMNSQMFNPQPFRPQMNQNFFNPTYNHRYRPNNFSRNQNRHHQVAKMNLKREKKKYRPNQPSGLKIITDYIELDDSDEEPQSKMLKIDSNIELIDLSEVAEDNSDKRELVQISDNSVSSNDIPVVENKPNDNNETEKSSNDKSEHINETEKSSNERLNETEKSSNEHVNATEISDGVPNWKNLKKVRQDGFEPILDYDKVISKESVYKSLQIFEPFESSSKNSTKLKISFDAYNPADHFKKSARSLPKFRIIVSSETDVFPTKSDLDSLHKIYDDGVPFLFAVTLEESIGFYLFDKVSINKFV